MTAAVKLAALAEGFVAVGIAPAAVPPHADRLRDWLARGWHADMGYMERNLVKRAGEEPLVEFARSVICLAAAIPPSPAPAGNALVARYAHGRDYHKVLKRKCVRLMDRLRGLAPGFEGRAFVDSAPVMERSLAAWSGVGWIGRNGCLVAPGLGSYVLLCEIISNLPLAPDGAIPSQCDGCGRCVKGCTNMGNGSLFMQIRHDRCVNCNDCSIARACPVEAISRVPASAPYKLKTVEGA